MKASRNCLIHAMLFGCLISAGSIAHAQRGGGPTDLLRRSDVVKELNLVDDQVKQLEALSVKRRAHYRKIYSDLGELSREDRNAKLRERFAEFNKETKKDLENILLPHQTKRLNQLVVQYQLRNGLSRTLTGGNISGTLEISNEQKERLQKRAVELGHDFQKRVEKIRNEVREKLLEELTPQQRAAWKELVGEEFVFQQMNRQDNE